MPLVLELIVLMLAAYTAGIGLGWLVWGSPRPEDDSLPHDLEHGDSP